MEFSWFYDKHALFMTFTAAAGGTLTVSSFRSSKYVSSFFWKLIQEEVTSIKINIQVTIG